MGALNKDTETLGTIFEKGFQTSCTAKNKSKFCRGYTYANRLMPCRTYNKDKKAVGIENKCDCCYHFNGSTSYGEEEYNAIAKKVRHRRFNRVDELKGVDEMKKFDRSADTTLITNFPTVEFPWLDDRVGGLTVKLGRAAHTTFRMNFPKIWVDYFFDRGPNLVRSRHYEASKVSK